jgi:hypothetical protein
MIFNPNTFSGYHLSFLGNVRRIIMYNYIISYGNPSSKWFKIPCLKHIETANRWKSNSKSYCTSSFSLWELQSLFILVYHGVSWCIVNPEIGSHHQATSQPGAFPRCRNNLRMPSLARPPDSGREASPKFFRNAETRFQDVIEMMCPPSFSGFQLVYLFWGCYSRFIRKMLCW